MSKSPYLDWKDDDDKELDDVVDSDEYGFHVDAMTRFELHGKSAIAAELARRDMEIKKLKAAGKKLVAVQGNPVNGYECLNCHQTDPESPMNIIHSDDCSVLVFI